MGHTLLFPDVGETSSCFSCVAIGSSSSMDITSTSSSDGLRCCEGSGLSTIISTSSDITERKFNMKLKQELSKETDKERTGEYFQKKFDLSISFYLIYKKEKSIA